MEAVWGPAGASPEQGGPSPRPTSGRKAMLDLPAQEPGGRAVAVLPAVKTRGLTMVEHDAPAGHSRPAPKVWAAARPPRPHLTLGDQMALPPSASSFNRLLLLVCVACSPEAGCPPRGSVCLRIVQGNSHSWRGPPASPDHPTGYSGPLGTATRGSQKSTWPSASGTFCAKHMVCFEPRASHSGHL